MSDELTSLIGQAKSRRDRWWIRIALASLLCTFLTDHRRCLERPARGPFTVGTVVPSHPDTRGGWDHLKDLFSCVAGDWPAAPVWDLDLLTKVGLTAAEQRRVSVDDDLFTVSSGRDVRGARVLLVDDLYTSGSTTASAARALVRAGAQPPVVVTVGRQLDPADRAVPPFLAANDILERRWEPDTCTAHPMDPVNYPLY